MLEWRGASWCPVDVVKGRETVSKASPLRAAVIAITRDRDVT
jgi:hypothetical protein